VKKLHLTAALVLIAIASAALLTHCWRGPAAGYIDDGVSEQTALAVAKSFEPLNSRILITSESSPTRIPGCHREIRLSSTVDELAVGSRSIFVDNSTFLYDPVSFYGRNFRRIVARHAEISEAEVQHVAYAYAMAHFRNKKLAVNLRMPMLGADQEPSYIYASNSTEKFKEYLVSFCCDPDGIGFSPCACTVSVEALTGRVVGYAERDVPLTVSLRPRISADIAMERAMRCVVTGGRKGSLIALGVTDPGPDLKERLVYFVGFTGKGPPSMSDYPQDQYHMMIAPLTWWKTIWLTREENAYIGMVDAHTGEFLGWEISPYS
jgi:hypothetical protein